VWESEREAGGCLRISPLGYPEAQTEQMNIFVLNQPDYCASNTLQHCCCHRGFYTAKMLFSEFIFCRTLFLPRKFHSGEEIPFLETCYRACCRQLREADK